MLPTKYLQLVRAFKITLDSFDYTLLTPSITSYELPIIKVAIRSKDKDAFIQQLAEDVDFEIVHSKMDATILTTTLNPQRFLTIELYHFFHSDRLTYLNIEEVLSQRYLANNGYFIPKLEHLLEFSILNSFLNEEGLNDRIIEHFEYLHIFLQEGLMDYFNSKYDTYFNSLYDLSDYKETIENHFRKQLKSFPINKFSNRMRLGWVNMKSLMKRSAIFSFMH